MSKTTEQKLLEKVQKTENCWIWTGARHEDGYGHVHLDGKTRKSTRAMYELYKGEIPAGMCVCHDCDNPSCVNPDHLYLDTQAGNLATMEAKGRANRGSKRKLNPDKVREIRRLHKDGVIIRELVTKYGVTRQQIYNVCSGKAWRDVE